MHDPEISTKAFAGHYFEDFRVGMPLIHPTPLTISAGDISLYRALTGNRFAIYSAETFARSVGFAGLPVDPLFVFNSVFGKTVADISLNAVANLGYADGRFLTAVYPGDTLRAVSQVIGLKENSNGKAGVVYVRTQGFNQHDDAVLSYIRWVMVNKRSPDAPAPKTVIPNLPQSVSPQTFSFAARTYQNWDNTLSGSPYRYEDYEIDETINHIDGMTIEEAEHQMATRLYQNTAKVHFDAHAHKNSRFGQRLVYGGVVISLARALAFNGLANAAEMFAINAGTHAGPLFAGDTIYASSTILDKVEFDDKVGALRVQLIAVKNQDPGTVVLRGQDGKYAPGVCLDFDYWAAIARR